MKIITTVRRVYRQLIGDKWSELYSVRALGMALILIYHAWTTAGVPIIVIAPLGITMELTGIFRASALGTTIVFVLAGFFNHLPYERAHQRGVPLPPTLPLIKRRLLRIAPLYYVCLTVGIIMAGGIAWLMRPGALVETLLSFTFLHSFVAQPIYGMPGGNWAVQAVMQFYILVPLLSRILTHKYWRVGVVILFVAVLAYRAYLVQPDIDGSYLEHQLWARLDQFILGMLAAKFVTFAELHGGMQRLAQWLGVTAALFGLVMGVAMSQNGSLEPNLTLIWFFTRMGFGLAIACLIIYMVLAPRGLVHRLASHWLPVAAGLIGFSIFMWHWLIFQAFTRAAWYNALLPPDRLKIDLTLGLVLTVVISIFSFVLLEMPFISRTSQKRSLV